MTQVPQTITYEQFKELAQPLDVRALALLGDGEIVKTQDLAEADVYQSVLERLWAGGLVSRIRRAKEDIGGDEWYTFDARVKDAAKVYFADAAMEYINILRNTPPPE